MSFKLNPRQLKKKLRRWSALGAVTCELTHPKSLDDVYSQLQEQLNLSSDFGKNLDALYDSLTTDVKGPVIFIWHDQEQSESDLGDDYHSLWSVLENVADERADFMFVIS